MDCKSEFAAVLLTVIDAPATTAQKNLLKALSPEKLGMTELAGNAVFLGVEEHRHALAGAEHLLTAAGRPAPNVEVRVLDEDGHEVATGLPGEIVIDIVREPGPPVSRVLPS